MTHPRTSVVVLLLILDAVRVLAQPETIGRIKMASGTAHVMRETALVPTQAGMALLEGDALRTGTDGHLGVTLRDDTRLSLGPNSEIRLSRFRYAPSDGNLALALQVVRGVVAYISGRIAKLSSGAVQLETPNALVGIRGTHVVIRVDALP